MSSFEGAPDATGGLSPAPVQSGGKRSAWISHVKKYAKDHGIKFGEALSKAGASFKKHSGGGGVLMGKGVPMGGKRTKKASRRKGGALYGFGGGNGSGNDGGLADGAAAYGDSVLPGSQGGSTLAGAGPAKGGRRSRRRSHRRNKSSKTAKVGGKRRR